MRVANEIAQANEQIKELKELLTQLKYHDHEESNQVL